MRSTGSDRRGGPRLRAPAAALAAALAAGLLTLACSDGGGTAPPDPAPVIVVEGVEDGGVYTGAVTIQVDVDRGSYSATLDGEPFLSGQSVSDIGPHQLVVAARAGTVTSTTTVDFTIEAPEGGMLIVRVIDLGANDAGGGGDAILLTDSTSAGMVHALIDAGPAGADGGDPGFVARRLAALGVDTLEAVILTHAHSDHFAGLDAVLAQVHVERFLYNGQERSYWEYTQLVAEAESRADEVLIPAAELPVHLGASSLTVLPPLPDYIPTYQGDNESSAYNEGSIGALLERGSFDMFLTGDGEVEANTRWRTEFPELTADLDVLKVGHHGANDAIFDDGFSGNSLWLEHTDPEVAIISGNGTTHPRRNALNRLLVEPALRTYCTNVHGDIELRVTSLGDYEVTVEREAESDCIPGTEAST